MKKLIFSLTLIHLGLGLKAQNIDNFLSVGCEWNRVLAGRFLASSIDYRFKKVGIPFSRIRYSRFFDNNQYQIEIAHQNEVLTFKTRPSNGAYLLDALPGDSLGFAASRWQITAFKNLYQTDNQRHHIYAGLGALYRYNGAIGIYVGDGVPGYPHFIPVTYHIMSHWGARFQFQYLFSYKFIGLSFNTGLNYFPRYRDLQYFTGLQLGFIIKDKWIGKGIHVFSKKKAK